MRDIPGLSPLLNRAATRAEQPAQYRFHGRRSPSDRQRTPVFDQAPSGAVLDGTAVLRLYEPIDSWGGVWGVSAVEFLEALDQIPAGVETIELHINSPGGEVWEALAILNSLRAHSARVVAIVDGIAASCASFIACAADETVMSPNSQLMIHDAWGLCVGNAAEMHATGDLLDQISDNIASIYATKAGSTVEEWRATMRVEGWYMAQEAVDAGLADRIAGQETTKDPADEFDLEGIGMKHQGRADAPDPTPPTAPVAPRPADNADDYRARFLARRHAENERKLVG
ncbi:MAG TPA: head maturation protease, ClpP-related [Phytomonospora sp.]